MPGLGRYPCPSCPYIANNRRMLARHAVLIHSEKVFKCPVCPFITRYAANWYRHKRDLHGLTKSANCEICGFFASNTAELAQHTEAEHPEHLQLEKFEDKYAREKLRLSGGGIQEPPPKQITVIKQEVVETEVPVENNVADEDNNECISFSLSSDGLLETNGEGLSANGTEDEISPIKAAMSSDADTSSDTLGPLKVKRSYNCDQCGLLTSNPREYLYHLRNTHGEKISVFECKYCIYASKHVQKLQRHCGLVHRQLIAKDIEYQKQLEAQKEKRSRPGMNRFGASLQPNKSIGNSALKTTNSVALKKPARTRGPLPFRCSLCPYQTRNKGFLLHHEKTVHLKKRFYRCLQCGYVTNEKGRYTKHIKYHSLPKMQCEYCFFKTAYKWNMDRHMKNHEVGAEGAFQCTECNFTTSTKQSFKAHVTNHHNNCSAEDFIDQQDDLNGDDESGEWADMDIMPDQAEENQMTPDENGSMESYDYPDSRDNSDTVWKDGKVYQKSLQCKLCDFKAAWPFEMKKHEENHRSQKKHPCPLCGMRFEHIAWLTKHLRRVHQDNTNATSIAAAFDLLKPARRRPGKEYDAEAVLPIFQNIIKQKKLPGNKLQDPPKNSMLSTLLNKPLQPIAPAPVNKFGIPYKSKALASAANMSRQLRISNFYGKTTTNETSSVAMSNVKSKNVPTCNVCGYKTRWISELQRHMRVHSQEKPFHCPKCKYHCKWKGDLNRHLMKYHGIKVPSSNKKNGFPRLKLKKTADMPANDWQPVKQDAKRSQFSSSTPIRNFEEEAPLDLTTKDTFPHPYGNSDSYDPYDFENFSSAVDEPIVDIETINDHDSSHFKSPLQHLRDVSYNIDDSSNNSSAKRKYQCPYCPFDTTTASKFHTHMVQHFNRRPFMCSVCGCNSNWEWDITKHIRLKGCTDRFHNKACVLLTDESGRKNYEKYDKYLVDINQPPPTVFMRSPDPTSMPDLEKYRAPERNSNRLLQVDQPNKNCSYDFRNIGSNFEDTPENIVVTPDINIPDQSYGMEQNFYGNQSDIPDGMAERFHDTNAKNFFCKHCDFKHTTKRVVISHLSVHAGIKPFRCRACGITSNWRHVIVRHVKDAHNGYMHEVEDRISYVQEGFALRLTSVSSNNQDSGINSPRNQAAQFGCKICPYKCDKETYIKQHMKQHRPREGAIFRCDYCPYFVKFKKTLIRHLSLHNPPSTNVTLAENFEDEEIKLDMFESRSSLDNNSSNVYDFYDNPSRDSPDDSIAISFDALNQYTNSESISPQKIKRHICESCPYKTDNKTQYLYHKQFHRPNTTAPFKCSICTYWATMQHLLTQHMKVHSDAEGETSENSAPKEKSIEITTVEKPESESDWTEKMSIVYVKRGDLIVKMFKCKFCPMMNKKKANVRVHQKMHGVTVNNGKFACSYCDYQCLNQGGLTNHIKIHQKVPEKEAYVEQETMDQSSTASDPNNDEFGSSRKKFFSYFCEKCPALFKSSHDLNTHSKFHGSSFPYSCPECDYRARHRPHLSQHMSVHSPEYQAKRNAAQRPPENDSSLSADPMLEASEIPVVKKIDQMLLLEASELNAAMKKTGEAANLLHRCMMCNAPFIKISTLTYHASLHGSDGEFKCSQCDYAVNRSSNLTIHSQMHPKKKPPPKPKKMPLKSFPCKHCPAVFYKLDRFERHSNLHGKNYRFACEHCDYSVRFAANLIKHKALHVAKPDAENNSSATKTSDDSASIAASPVAAKPLTENTNFLETDEKKVTYICDRCPYFQNRRDAVQSHQRRHWYKDGFKCPYCDYTSMQSGFVQSHIKMHIQPHQLFPAQAFMKYESFKIFCKDDGEDALLFDDQVMMKEKHSDTNHEGKRKKRKAEENGERRKIRKSSTDSASMDSNSSDSLCKTKVPVVMLSDILSDKDIKKWAPKLKIPKLKITKCTDSNSSEKIYSKLNISYDSEDKLQTTLSKPVPSLVVKISKVESSSKSDKAVYSVCTKTSVTSEHSPNIIIKKDSVETPNSSDIDPVIETPDTAFSVPADSDAQPDNSISNTKDSENENKGLGSSNVETLNEMEDSKNLLPSVDEIDMKSEESFSSDTVPEVVSDVLCDKLSVLSDLSFEKNLPLTNGETDSHITNGVSLLPEEIAVEL